MTNSSSRGRGRPTLLTPQLIARLAKAVQSGKTRAEAADEVGVSLSALQKWITVGRRARSAGVMPVTKRNGEQLALRLVHALEVAERKNRAITAILSPAELRPTLPSTYKPIGRPALLTETVLDAVAPLVAAGKIGEAGRAAGVDRRSVQRWLVRGAEVHATGSARTEYERLCGLLYARAHAPVEGQGSASAEETPTAPAPEESERPAAPDGPARAVPDIVVSTKPRRRLLGGLISSRFGLRRTDRV
ncbi:hypothetical protein [Streptomyces rimosus]|uniref:hypothetical protein n=1 Tax=Streptomyces rimosus TaxID=1927 RepID=UPI0004BF308A|nr:hypothetical protein [Streptomyces rimosus]